MNHKGTKDTKIVPKNHTPSLILLCDLCDLCAFVVILGRADYWRISDVQVSS